MEASDGFFGTLKRKYRTANSKLSVIFAVALIFNSAISVVASFWLDIPYPIFTVQDAVFTAIGILIGVYIILDKNRSVIKTAALYSFNIALNRIPMAIEYMCTRNQSDTANIISFSVGAVMLFFAGSIAYTGISYLRNRCRGYMITTVGVSLMILLDSYITFIVVLVYSQVGDYGEALTFIITMCPKIFLDIMYVALINSNEVHRVLPYEKISKDLAGLRSSLVPETGAGVMREDARKLIEGPDSWNKVENFGPVEREFKFRLVYTDTFFFCLAQKWKDSERIHFTVMLTEKGTVVETGRFHAEKIKADDSFTTLFFTDGNGDEVSLEIVERFRKSIE